MRYSIFLSAILIFLLFDFQIQSQSKGDRDNKLKTKFDITIDFMDSYMKFCNSRQNGRNAWIKNNSLLTDRFKSTFIKFVDSTPELDFDPIFDAQDYPDRGFKILKCDSTNGYVILNGIDLPEFTVIVKIANQNQKWLVDGAGIINIPKDRQRKERQQK